MEFVADLGASAVLSSHLLADVERVCDYLIVLCDSQVQIAGDVRRLLAGHHLLLAPRGDLDQLPAGAEAIYTKNTLQESSALVRAEGPPPDGPWTAEPVELEHLVLAYMTRAAGDPVSRVGAGAATTGAETLIQQEGKR
jgi:ABC-2 type transport system ATP-binding protein